MKGPWRRIENDENIPHMQSASSHIVGRSMFCSDREQNKLKKVKTKNKINVVAAVVLKKVHVHCVVY